MKVECGGLLFTSDFDSGNLHRVEHVPPSNEVEMDACASNNYRFSRKQKTSNTPKSSPVHVKKGNLKKRTLHPYAKSCIENQNQSVLEFKVWTRPDCHGTPFQTTFRTWFNFGVEGGTPGTVIKVNVMNLNRQGKLYFHGMKPVFKIVPSKDDWKRIPGKVDFKCESEGNFIISFCHPLPTESKAVTYFAFTYPFSYSDCQSMLDEIDTKIGSSLYLTKVNKPPENAVYYCRELLCHSSESNRVELLTITSCKGLTMEREKSPPDLFPDQSKLRCHIFQNKKVIFISSRVHPGETPSSFVLNGMLHYLLRSKEGVANRLRNLYVFKVIPMLNPDGVMRGHYRADLQGLNLNRIYMIANFQQHPSIYAARTLLLHYHTVYSSVSTETTIDLKNAFKKSKPTQLQIPKQLKPNFITKKLSKDVFGQLQKKTVIRKHPIHACDTLTRNLNFLATTPATTLPGLIKSKTTLCDSVSIGNSPKKSKRLPALSPPGDTNLMLSMDNMRKISSSCMNCSEFVEANFPSKKITLEAEESCNCVEASDADDSSSFDYEMRIGEGDASKILKDVPCLKPEDSGIAYFFDLHGHASKRGCFIYGNYFPDIDKMVECMYLPKLMSINCPYFDFSACNFSAENMYSGSNSNIQSKEGSGRVSLYVLTGIIRSYTLECNYNTCRFVASQRKPNSKNPTCPVFFTPEIYQQIGEALLISILDAAGTNPRSQICHSPFLSLQGVREWLKQHALSVKGRCLDKDAPINRARARNKNTTMSMILRRSSLLSASTKTLSQESSSRPTNLAASTSDLNSKPKHHPPVNIKGVHGSVSLLSSPVSQRPLQLQRRHTFSTERIHRSFLKRTTLGQKNNPT